jgi:hypothetical protein
MNETSAEGAFLINSVTPTGSFSWSGNTMTFTTDPDLDYNTVYTCTMGTGATDSAGNPMTAYPWSFTTMLGPPTVVSVSPSEGATGVPITTSAISITFSQEMNTAYLSASMDPSVKASCSWDAAHETLTCTLNANLAPNTTYTCSVNAVNTFGTFLVTPKVWSFTTGS